LHMPGGNLDVAKKGRGKKFSKNFNKRVLKDIEEHKQDIKEVAISYVDTPEDMEVWTNKIKEINHDIKVLTRVTSTIIENHYIKVLILVTIPIIATHAGSCAYAVFYTTEDF